MFGPYLCHVHGSNRSALEEGSRLYTMIFVYNELSKGQHCVTSYSFYKGHYGHNTCCPHANYMRSYIRPDLDLYGAISSYIGTYIVGTGLFGTNIVHVHPIDLRYTIGI